MYNSEYAYIAAQAPTETSIEEFKEEEDGVIKSTKYWPDAERRSIEIDSEKLVQFESESCEYSVGTSVIVRKFVLTNKVTAEEKRITHFQYIGWPDKEVP